MNRRLIAIACLALAGCSTLSYQEPTAGERARVRFASQSDHVVVVRAYDDANCSANEQEWMRLRSGKLMSSSPKRLGMPLWRFHENGAKELYVATARPFHGLFIGGDNSSQGSTITTHSCGVAMTFDFKPGLDYEVEYQWDRTACSVSVSQVVGAAASATLVPLQTFTNRSGGADSKCGDAFRKQRLY